jgi:hypothetical protein
MLISMRRKTKVSWYKIGLSTKEPGWGDEGSREQKYV